MGSWKDRMIRQDEQGWDFVDDGLHLCADCFDDKTIQQFIEENANEKECSYCKESSDQPIAVSMNSVLEIIGSAVAYGYEDPANSLPVEGGEYVFDTMNIDEVLDEVGWPTQSDKVIDEIRDAFGDRAWVQKNFFGLREDEQLRYGWNDFVEAVKYRTRYLFAVPCSDDDDLAHDKIPPHKMLAELGEVIGNVELIHEIKAGTRWFRVRIHKAEETYSTASELGTVEQSKAVFSNRMSPAGIPMFYGAEDETTAIAETLTRESEHGAVATVATFELTRDMEILDLTDLPPVPSFFDVEKRSIRLAISFLHDFVEDLTKPIAKDGREHIEYVPTQIVTEYFRYVSRTSSGESVKGILYRSSQNDRVCCVLFFENERCCQTATGWEAQANNWLGLSGVSQKEL